MKKIALILILMLIVSIIIVGCKGSVKEESTNPTVSQGVEESIKGENDPNIGKDKDEFYVRIKSKGSKRFFNGGVAFNPKVEGGSTKKVKYKWTIEYSQEEEEFIDGLVGKEGPVKEIINTGEEVSFGVYAEVSYVPGAYSERKIKLQVLDSENEEVLAEDSVKIKNYEGYYIVESTRDEKLAERILKTSNAKIYGEMIDKVWDIDSALNSGVSYINVDTRTFDGFNEEDKKQLFEYIAEQYDAEILDKTMEELKDKGYIQDLSFNDGIVFSIDKYIENSEDKISLEGRKWASGIGAIGFIFEAEKVNDKWIIKKCEMTWIS